MDSFDIQSINVFDTKSKKQSKFKLDFIFDKIEDLVFEYEGETYVLKSNKPPKQRSIEKSMTEFGEKYFTELADKHPNYGVDPNYKLTYAEVKSMLIEKLNTPEWSSTPLYKEVIIKKSAQYTEALIRAFVTFVATIRVTKQKEFEDKKYRLSPVISEDYLMRFKSLVLDYKANKHTLMWFTKELISITTMFKEEDRLRVNAQTLLSVFNQCIGFIDTNETDIGKAGETVRMERYTALYANFDKLIDGLIVTCNTELNKIYVKKHSVKEAFDKSGSKYKYVYFLKLAAKLHTDIINKYDSALDNISSIQQHENNDKDKIYQCKAEFGQAFKAYIEAMDEWALDVSVLNEPITDQGQLVLDAQIANVTYYLERRDEKPDWIETIIADLRVHVLKINDMLTTYPDIN